MMKINSIRALLVPLFFWGSLSSSRADVFPDNIDELFTERVKSIVAVEYFIQREIERQPTDTAGLVLDDDGVIVVLGNAVPLWLPPEQFKDFKIYLPGEGGDGYDAEYLGHDYLNGWHYIRVVEEARAFLTPITQFESKTPAIGNSLWGIGIMGKDFYFEPYLLDGRLSQLQRLPLTMGFSQTPLSVPGGPVFDSEGRFVGWANNSLTHERFIYMPTDQYKVRLHNPRESETFLLADEFFNNANRIPSRQVGDPLPWIGVAGVQAVDREVARFIGLKDRGAVIISTVLDEGPASEAGLQEKDIVVAIDGEALPKFRPDVVVKTYFDRQIMLRDPGDSLALSVIRGQDRTEIVLTVGFHPKPYNQAQRNYFTDLGFTIREFVLGDAITRQLSRDEMTGVIVSFVNQNSSVNRAGLMIGDWVKEIDGIEFGDYESAVDLLNSIMSDDRREDYVLLISRDNETSVLRVGLR